MRRDGESVGQVFDLEPSRRTLRARHLDRSEPELRHRRLIPTVGGGVKVAERMIEANGVELCTESFGRPADPPILLIMGIGASMLWWEEGFCRLLAEGGRFVIRYDQRDTGRSVTYEPGRPEYTSTDLIADSVGVLDVYGIAGCARGRRLGRRCLRAAARTRLPQSRPLARPHQHVARDAGRTRAPVGHGAVPAVRDERDRGLVGREVGDRVSGGLRARARRRRAPVRRGCDTRACPPRRRPRAQYRLLRESRPGREGEIPREPLSTIAVPTLVIHGTADPMFPLEHGEALARDIPVHGCSRSREPDTESSEPTGRPSPAPSSRTPSSAIVAGEVAELERTTAAEGPGL